MNRFSGDLIITTYRLSFLREHFLVISLLRLSDVIITLYYNLVTSLSLCTTQRLSFPREDFLVILCH